MTICQITDCDTAHVISHTDIFIDKIKTFTICIYTPLIPLDHEIYSI